ncbi:uncharacterized protein TNCV_255001 [Trichonephila clavipes]|nr:uncharacterized protein TNCV_255001 [Trichonephila clavipes]
MVPLRRRPAIEGITCHSEHARHILTSGHRFTCRNCGGGDRGRVAIYRPFGEVSLSLNRTVTCMVLKANDRRTSCPCHDEFRGPRSDYVRQSLVNSLVTLTKMKYLIKVALLSIEIVTSQNYAPLRFAINVLETLQEVFFSDEVKSLVTFNWELGMSSIIISLIPPNSFFHP